MTEELEGGGAAAAALQGDPMNMYNDPTVLDAQSKRHGSTATGRALLGAVGAGRGVLGAMSGAKRDVSLSKDMLHGKHGTAFDWSNADFQDHDEDGDDDKTDAGWNVIKSMRGAHRSMSGKGVGEDLAAILEDSEEAVRREIITRGEKAFEKDIGEMQDMDDEADKAMQVQAGKGGVKKGGRPAHLKKNPFDGHGGQHGTAGRAHERDKRQSVDDGGGKPKLVMMEGGKMMLNTETGAMTNVSTNLSRLQRSQFSCDLDSLLPTLDAPLGSCPIPAGPTGRGMSVWDKGGGGDRGASPSKEALEWSVGKHSDFSFENQMFEAKKRPPGYNLEAFLAEEGRIIAASPGNDGRPPCAECAHRDFCICPGKLPASSRRLNHPIILYNDVGEPISELGGGVEGGASAGGEGGEGGMQPEWQSRVQKVHSGETKVHSRPVSKCPNVHLSIVYAITCSIHSQNAKDGKNENPRCEMNECAGSCTSLCVSCVSV